MIWLHLILLFIGLALLNWPCLADNVVYHRFENDFSSDLFQQGPNLHGHKRSAEEQGHNLLLLKQFENKLKLLKSDLAKLQGEKVDPSHVQHTSTSSIPTTTIASTSKANERQSILNDAVETQKEAKTSQPETLPSTFQPPPFHDSGQIVTKLVKDSEMLRLLLEALIVDDLNGKHQSLDLPNVMKELQNRKQVLERADQKAEQVVLESNQFDAPPRADRSTQASDDEQEEELTDVQLDFFGDGI